MATLAKVYLVIYNVVLTIGYVFIFAVLPRRQCKDILFTIIPGSEWLIGMIFFGKGNHTELNQMKLFCCMFVNCHVIRLPAALEKNSIRIDGYLLKLINHSKKDASY